jgi:hypothetical protein
MNNQIIFLVPPLADESNEFEHSDDAIFEQKGTIEEILLLGPQVPIAAKLSRNQDLQPRIVLELVHLHATRDHIVLMDPTLLSIQAEEEQALRNSVADTLDHYLGSHGEFLDSHWIYPAGDFLELQTHSPSLVSGLNMDIWMPKDTKTPGIAKKWRQLQNEIQMIWHDHPVNEARLERGELPINSVWLHGIGCLTDIIPHPLLNDVQQIFSNHYLGNSLDARLNPLSLESIVPNKDHHHFVFAQHLAASEWERYWQKSLSALHNKELAQIQLIRHLHGAPQKHHLSLKDLELGLLTKIFRFQQRQNLQYPSWLEYSKKILWSN